MTASAANAADLSEYHPQAQKLSCPGCNSKFVRGAAMMQHMESGSCSSIAPEVFARARMVNAIVHGAFGAGDNAQEAADYVERLDLQSDSQFPIVGSRESPQGAGKNLARQSYVPSEIAPPETFGEPSTSSINVVAPGMPRALPQSNTDQMMALQGLTRKVLGADMGIRRKVREDGSPYDMTFRHPMSPFFVAELFRDKQGQYECPFEGCRLVFQKTPLSGSKAK